MMNTSNGMISGPSSSSASAANPQSPGIKTYFKTPEGKYKLHYEKTHPSGLLHYTHGKTVTQVKIWFVFFGVYFWIESLIQSDFFALVIAITKLLLGFV